jgi:cytidine deaminase
MDDTAHPSDAALLERAREAAETAYAPYSEYAVGAALVTADGTVFTGCNVENANYSNSLHAEEVALGGAVSAGHREFRRIAVSSAARDGVTPCGMCRQSLAEFCGEDFPVLTEGEAGADADADADAGPRVDRLGDLIPDTISPETLGVDPTDDG